VITFLASGDAAPSVSGRHDASRSGPAFGLIDLLAMAAALILLLAGEAFLALSASTAILISPTFLKRCYPLAVTDGPVRVTEPLLDVLEVLLDARDHELYGWAITKATKRSSPTIYKILERLTDYGMVDARWEDHHPDVNKPRRRFYRLTGHGAAAATQLLQERRAQRPGPSARPRPIPGWAGA
jgi:PadR family transcriptional regulator PadR